PASLLRFWSSLKLRRPPLSTLFLHDALPLSQRRDPPPYRPDPAAGAGPQSGPAPERPAPVQPAGYAAQRGDAAAALVSLLREPAGCQALARGLGLFPANARSEQHTSELQS